jgi:hypothetical protein
MKKVLLLLLFISVYSLSANPAKVLISSVTKGKEADSIDAHRIVAASKLAIDMTKSYITIPDSTRRNYIKAHVGMANADSIAKALGATFLVSTGINTFHEMMRANITLTNIKTKKELKGFGFAPIRYIKDGMAIYDVALVQSIQRALMSALQDSALYSHQPKDYNTKPAETLVIGGFIFDENKEPFIWKMFSNKSISSYFASATIFDAAKDADNFATYDLSTRDSMYAAFNLYLLENSSPPGTQEVKILNVFGVQNYIFGSIKRIDNYAEVKIMLAKVKDDKLVIYRTEKNILRKDNDDLFAEMIKTMTRKILSRKDSEGITN